MNRGANLRRLMNEANLIKRSADEDSVMFRLNRVGDDMYHWTAVIYGPEDSLYENYEFNLDISLSDNYPASPLTIKFITPIQHVNVNNNGDICMDILKNNWSSSINIRAVLISLISLLGNPNTDDPLNSDLAELYRNNKKQYEKQIRKACEKHAIRRKISEEKYTLTQKNMSEEECTLRQKNMSEVD